MTSAAISVTAGSASRVFRLSNQPAPYASDYTRIDANVNYPQAKIYYTVTYFDGHTPIGAGPDIVNGPNGIIVYGTTASGAFTGCTNPTVTTTTAWTTTSTFAP